MADKIALLQFRIEKLWARTGLGPALSVTTKPSHDGGPHVVVMPAGYSIIGTERGAEIYRYDDLSLDEAAAWFLDGMAAGHAQTEELHLRKDGTFAGYSRWNWMARAVKILGEIDQGLAENKRAEYLKVLAEHPLDDEEIRFTAWDLP